MQITKDMMFKDILKECGYSRVHLLLMELRKYGFKISFSSNYEDKEMSFLAKSCEINRVETDFLTEKEFLILKDYLKSVPYYSDFSFQSIEKEFDKEKIKSIKSILELSFVFMSTQDYIEITNNKRMD